MGCDERVNATAGRYSAVSNKIVVTTAEGVEAVTAPQPFFVVSKFTVPVLTEVVIAENVSGARPGVVGVIERELV